jgi:CRP/FNR family cyclic AMP-dependent transcriptional regulator
MVQSRPPATSEVSRVDAIARVLAESAWLGTLSPGVRREMVAAGTSVMREAGEMLCQAGDSGDAFYVVLQGEVEVLTRSRDGRHVRLAALRAGSLAGEMAAFDGGARSADMVAARRSHLWRVPRVALMDALAAEPQAALAVIGELSRRLRAANALIEGAAFLDLGGRLAKMLLQEAGANQVVALTQTEIARRISASREKVNRKLHGWAREGWVELSPRGVRLSRPEALRSLIDAPRPI